MELIKPHSILVFSRVNLPSRWPIWETAILWLLFDRLSLPQWVLGAVGVLVVIWWFAIVVSKSTQKQVKVKIVDE